MFSMASIAQEYVLKKAKNAKQTGEGEEGRVRGGGNNSIANYYQTPC